LWQLLALSHDAKVKGVKRSILTKGFVFVLVLYLIWIIDSKTALMCFLLANVLITLMRVSRGFRKPVLATSIVVAMIASCYCVLFLGMGSGALETLGRNSDLTGRTEIWALLLQLVKNPWLGTGYEDFWMGERLEIFAQKLVFLN